MNNSREPRERVFDRQHKRGRARTHVQFFCRFQLTLNLQIRLIDTLPQQPG
jgi:hypothetical protein